VQHIAVLPFRDAAIRFSISQLFTVVLVPSDRSEFRHLTCDYCVFLDSPSAASRKGIPSELLHHISNTELSIRAERVSMFLLSCDDTS
jgi:hypothetical protein